jgi:hypothetical protein
MDGVQIAVRCASLLITLHSAVVMAKYLYFLQQVVRPNPKSPPSFLFLHGRENSQRRNTATIAATAASAASVIAVTVAVYPRGVGAGLGVCGSRTTAAAGTAEAGYAVVHSFQVRKRGTVAWRGSNECLHAVRVVRGHF